MLNLPSYNQLFDAERDAVEEGKHLHCLIRSNWLVREHGSSPVKGGGLRNECLTKILEVHISEGAFEMETTNEDNERQIRSLKEDAAKDLGVTCQDAIVSFAV